MRNRTKNTISCRTYVYWVPEVKKEKSDAQHQIVALSTVPRGDQGKVALFIGVALSICPPAGRNLWSIVSTLQMRRWVWGLFVR